MILTYWAEQPEASHFNLSPFPLCKMSEVMILSGVLCGLHAVKY